MKRTAEDLTAMVNEFYRINYPHDFDYMTEWEASRELIDLYKDFESANIPAIKGVIERLQDVISDLEADMNSDEDCSYEEEIIESANEIIDDIRDTFGIPKPDEYFFVQLVNAETGESYDAIALVKLSHEENEDGTFEMIDYAYGDISLYKQDCSDIKLEELKRKMIESHNG